MAFKNSHVPVTVEGGVTFGPMRGVSVEVSWLYAAANDWLMPVVPEDGLTIFTPTKMRGYRFRGALGYRYGTRMELKLAYETAPQGPSRGYYLWRDRARHLVSADLRVCPVKQLDVTVGWEYRQGGRRFVPTPARAFPSARFPTSRWVRSTASPANGARLCVARICSADAIC